jgi:hypothetical protein
MKAYRQYPATRAAWSENYEIAKTCPAEFFKQVSAWLTKKKKKPAFFRLHVAGDIFSDEYMHADGLVAGEHYLPGIPVAQGGPDFSLIAQAARTWYRPHGLERHVAFIREAMQSQRLRVKS